MSKKAMRRGPTSRNERRKTIAAKVGAGGACPRHGVYDGFKCPGCSGASLPDPGAL